MLILDSMKKFLLSLNILTLICLCSCFKDAAPDYNELSTDLLINSFQSIKDKEHKQAIAKLESYQTASKDERVGILRSNEFEAQELAKFNAFLDDMDFEAASKSINDARTEMSITEKMEMALEFLNAIEAIELYLYQKPYKQSQDARFAFKDLPKVSTFKTKQAQAVFSKWQKKEMAGIDAMEKYEKTKISKELLYQLDLDLVTGGQKKQTMLFQIAQLVPKHPILDLNYTGIDDLKKMSTLQRDLKSLLLIDSLPKNHRINLLKYYESIKVETYAAKYLQIQSAAHFTKINLAIKRFVNLKAEVKGIDRKVIFPYINRHLVTSPAKKTLSIDSILEQLYYLNTKE